VKWKRIVASIVGAIAVLAGLVALVYSIEAIQDFWNSAVPLRLAILGEFIMCSMVFAALTIGLRLLRFAWRGRSNSSNGWMWPKVIGIASFFPGFVSSLPLTLLWARHTWPGDGQSYLAAMEVSCYVGVLAAVVCSVVLLRKRRQVRT
jgi:hypothetical protein